MSATTDYKPVSTTSVELTSIDSNASISINVKREKSTEQIKIERRNSETKLGLGDLEYHQSKL